MVCLLELVRNKSAPKSAPVPQPLPLHLLSCTHLRGEIPLLGNALTDAHPSKPSLPPLHFQWQSELLQLLGIQLVRRKLMADPISATCPKFLYDNSHSLYPYPTKRVRKQPRQVLVPATHGHGS